MLISCAPVKLRLDNFEGLREMRNADLLHSISGSRFKDVYGNEVRVCRNVGRSSAWI